MKGVDFTLDLGLQGLAEASPFTYHIDIANTPDYPKPNPNSISLRSLDSPFQFSYGGQNYMFSLLGFSKDKGKSFLPELVLNENSSIRLGLYGRFDVVSAVPGATPVPLPAAWGLLSLGLLGFSTLARKAEKIS